MESLSKQTYKDFEVIIVEDMTVNHEKIPPNVLKEWVKLITDELSQVSKIKRSDKARA